MQIQKTKNYDSFQVIIANREVDRNHVKKLAQSISKKNLLHIRPVICNERMQVIDGQHRIEACRLINQPVYYIQVADLTKEDITVLNTAQKNWTTMDFINFYAIEGRTEYRQFSKLINRFAGMKVTTLLRLCGNSKNVRQGQLDIRNIRNAEAVCQRIQQLRNKGFEFVYERDFGLALADTVKSEVEFQALLAQANSNNFYKCNSFQEYCKLIQQIA